MNTTMQQRVLRTIYNAAQRIFTLDVTYLMLLDRARLQDPGPLAEGLELFQLTPVDVRDYACDPSNDLDRSLVQRLAAGRDLCFGARHGRRLAGYSWYGLGSIEDFHNHGRTLDSGTPISFPDRMAFLYKAFTHPTYRGRGVYKHVNNFALAQLREVGVQSILATTDWSNSWGLKSCWRLGFVPLGKIWRFGVGSRVAGVYPTAAKRLGIRFGKAAQVIRRQTDPRVPLATQNQ